MLPEGWKKISLADAVRQKISYGIVQAGPHVDGGIPYIKSSDVRDDISLTSLQRTSTDIHRKYIRSSVHPGDIVFSLRGNIGATCIVPPEISEANLTQGTARISCSQKVHPNFLIQELRTSSCIQQALNLSKGSTFKEISLESLRTLKIILPPLPEQKKIAAILSTWDRAIEGTEKLLANSQQQKKALMQQLLTGKKRLPGFTGEWKPHSLSELAVMSSGGTPLSTQKDYFGGNIPWVSIADMTRCGKYISQTEKTLTKSGLDNSSAKIYPKNTVLYAMYASIGECSIASTELSCSQAILGIRTNSKLYFEYLYFYLSFLKEKIKLLGQTGTQSNLNAKMVKAFRINLPPIPEQKAIAAVLSTADEEITAIESDLSRLRQEKKALMQQLLTGKRRVKVD